MTSEILFQRDELVALTALCNDLNLQTYSRDLAVSAILAEVATRRVAVVGLVKRGKSTLVNSLIGEDLSPVNFLPETASVLCFMRSTAAAAHGITFEGKRKRLRLKPSSFTSDVSREARKPLLAAMYRGPLTLPNGLCLIDTPGAYESDVTSRSLLRSGMPESLYRLCDGFIVVMGVPGLSAIDMQLLESLNEVVGTSSVRVVLKALDSGYKYSEMKDYSEQVLVGVPNETFVIADSDQHELELLLRSLGPLRNHDDSTVFRESQSITKAVQCDLFTTLRQRAERDELEFPRHLLKSLPGELADLVERFGKGEFKRRQEKEAAESRRAELAKRKAEREAWRNTNADLRQSFKSCRSELIGAQKALNDARPRLARLGFGLWILFGGSFFFFPVGPIIAVAIMWFFYSKLESEFAKSEPHLTTRVQQAQEALNRSERLWAVHQKHKPS